MIKHLTLMLAAALLVFNLTACGCSAKDSGNTGNTAAGQETTGTTNDSTSPNTGTSNGESGAGTGGGSMTGGQNTNGGSSGNSTSGTNGDSQNGSTGGNSLLDDAQNAVNNGIDNAQNALDGTNNAAKSHAGGVSFQKMLENGRVHDRDGDLTDGENSRSYGKLF